MGGQTKAKGITSRQAGASEAFVRPTKKGEAPNPKFGHPNGIGETPSSRIFADLLKPRVARTAAEKPATGAPTTEDIQSPKNPALREELVRAAERLGRSVTATHRPDSSREHRLQIQAYADVYGIKLFHTEGSGRGRLLTVPSSELARLRRLRREAVREHYKDIVRFRAKRASQKSLRALRSWTLSLVRVSLRAIWKALKFVLIGIPKFIVIGIPRWIIDRVIRFFRYEIEDLAENRAVRKFVLTTIGLYILFGIAWGFHTPIDLSQQAVHWGIRHPHTVWRATRVLSGGGFGLWALLLIRSFLERRSVPQQVYVPPPPPPAPVRRYEIENFREESPFGSANFAKRKLIARALERQSGFSPQFED